MTWIVSLLFVLTLFIPGFARSETNPILLKCLQDFPNEAIVPSPKFSPLPEGHLAIYEGSIWLGSDEIQIMDSKTGLPLNWLGTRKPNHQNVNKFGSCLIFFVKTKVANNGPSEPYGPGAPVVVDLRSLSGETIENNLDIDFRRAQRDFSDFTFKDKERIYFLYRDDNEASAFKAYYFSTSSKEGTLALPSGSHAIYEDDYNSAYYNVCDGSIYTRGDGGRALLKVVPSGEKIETIVVDDAFFGQMTCLANGNLVYLSDNERTIKLYPREGESIVIYKSEELISGSMLQSFKNYRWVIYERAGGHSTPGVILFDAAGNYLRSFEGRIIIYQDKLVFVAPYRDQSSAISFKIQVLWLNTGEIQSHNLFSTYISTNLYLIMDQIRSWNPLTFNFRWNNIFAKWKEVDTFAGRLVIEFYDYAEIEYKLKEDMGHFTSSKAKIEIESDLWRIPEINTAFLSSVLQITDRGPVKLFYNTNVLEGRRRKLFNECLDRLEKEYSEMGYKVTRVAVKEKDQVNLDVTDKYYLVTKNTWVEACSARTWGFQPKGLRPVKVDGSSVGVSFEYFH